MKKFPVISERGNEYKVEIVESRFYRDYYEVYVYEQYIGWFGRKRFLFLNEQWLGYPRSYDANRFNFDFIAMAKHEIKRMEDEWEECEKRERMKADAVCKFEEWDGVIM